MKTIYPKTARILSVFAVGVAAGEVLIDWITHIQLNVSIIYSIPLVLAGLSRRRGLLWGLLLALLCVTFAVYAVQIEPGTFSLREPLFRNRVLSSVTMVLTTALLHMWTRVLDVLDAHDRALTDQNVRLQAAYRELEGYQQQIQRQNQELEQRRREAEAASERKTILLASVSHDIRTPLAAISLGAQAIVRSTDTSAADTTLPALARHLLANTVALANLVSDVLDFSTFELGRVQLHLDEFPLEDLIREQCRNLLPLAQAKRLLLVAEPIGEQLWLRTDPVKLGRVLTNLIMNAIKYTREGSVRIAAGRTHSGAAWIRVLDSGIGIAPEDRERIFDEFAQLGDPSNAHAKGYGLGLAICRRLVSMMGGTLGIERSSTEGSVFILNLPPVCVATPRSLPVPLPDCAHASLP